MRYTSLAVQLSRNLFVFRLLSRKESSLVLNLILDLHVIESAMILVVLTQTYPIII